MVGHALPRGYEHITFVFRVVLVAVGTQYHQNINSTWPNIRFSSLGWVRETRNAGTKLVKCVLLSSSFWILMISITHSNQNDMER